MNKTIRITCKTGFTADIEHLHPLQGDLKDLSKESYEKLKNEIVKEGFDAPFFIWTDEHQVSWILDGTQRHRTLTRMREEKFIFGQLPIVPIEAASIDEAKRKLLGYASQYGQMTSQGLYEFASSADIPFDELKSRYRFPEINEEKFEEEFYEDSKVVEGEDDVPELSETNIKLGDLFILGRHKLLCGDATNKANVERLMSHYICDCGEINHV